MITKKFIFEDDSIDEMTDFDKVLALNKHKISFLDVEFVDSNGKSYSDIIEVKRDGIYFDFTGVAEYLRFFFPEMYGDDDSDGYYEARYFESMYEGTWDWYEDISDSIDSDYDEGDTIRSFNQENLNLTKEILAIINPTVGQKITTDNNARLSDNVAVEIANTLSTLELKDELIGAYANATSHVYDELVPKEIKDTYCDCLKQELGVEALSCFHMYKMDWMTVILLFAQYGGNDEDLFLDVLFEAIKNLKTITHLPEYYEVRYNVWDEQKFNNYFQTDVEQILEKALYKLEFDDRFSNEYLEVVRQISKLGGFDKWIHSKDKTVRIRLNKIELGTNKVQYTISKNYKTKSGKAKIEDIINLIYNKTLFDPLEY